MECAYDKVITEVVFDQGVYVCDKSVRLSLFDLWVEIKCSFILHAALDLGVEIKVFI